MNGFWEDFAVHAAGRTALVTGDGRAIGYGALRETVADLADRMLDRDVRSVCTLVPDDEQGAALLLASLCAGAVLVPIAPFASAEQVAHVLASVRPDLVVVAAGSRPAGLDLEACGTETVGAHDWVLRAGSARADDPGRDTALITYTSGSTGTPKGVCLPPATLDATSAALVEATDAGPDDRHVRLHPFAVLLELVGGLLRALRCGAEVHLPRLDDGAVCATDGARILAALEGARATSAILVPAMLDELVRELERSGRGAPDTLRFVGVGGAVVPEALLRRAAGVGVPVFQGYGATECGSVIALNGPDDDRPGSVGRPLPHVRVEISDEGEILVGGKLFLGYHGEPRRGDAPCPEGDLWPTGDLGCLDEDGYLHVRGRRSNVFSTALGRNVSAEWLEERLQSLPSVRQAVVFGEGFPAPVAVLVARPGGEADVRRELARLEPELPSYARPSAVHVRAAPFTVADGHWLPTGRPHRAAILRDHLSFFRPAEPVS